MVVAHIGAGHILVLNAGDALTNLLALNACNITEHTCFTEVLFSQVVSTDNLAKEYFGEAGMLGYVAGVQRKEIRQGIACVKHQNMAGSDMGDDHKEYFSGDAALKAGGADNTMNQFG